MVRRVAAGKGRFVVLNQRLNEKPPGGRGRDMKILTGNSNRPLAEAIAAKLALPLVKANIRRFSDNEIFVEILENVRGEDMFVLQSTSFPANDHLMELLITIDALRRSSARRITAVMPYYGYARQDRRTGPRTPISAKLVANLITHAGRQPRADARPACRADPGLLRHPGRQPVCRPGVQQGHQGNADKPQPYGRVARCRRRGARPRDRQAHRRRPRHHRQAPRAGRRQRGHERDRRRQECRLHPDRRHRRFRPARSATPPSP